MLNHRKCHICQFCKFLSTLMTISSESWANANADSAPGQPRAALCSGRCPSALGLSWDLVLALAASQEVLVAGEELPGGDVGGLQWTPSTPPLERSAFPRGCSGCWVASCCSPLPGVTGKEAYRELSSSMVNVINAYVFEFLTVINQNPTDAPGFSRIHSIYIL